MKKLIMVILLGISSVLNAIKLSEINGLKRLNMYDQIKNFETDRIISKEESKKVNGIIYAKGEDSPFNGVIVTGDKKGNIIDLSIIKNGKLDFLSFKFYENGKVRLILGVKNGILEGWTQEYYESGEGKSQKFYKNGKLRNITEWYDKSSFKRTLEIGENMEADLYFYYPNGPEEIHIEAIAVDKENGVGYKYKTVKLNDELGRKLKVKIEYPEDSKDNGLVNGLNYFYDKNGKLKYEIAFKDANPENFKIKNIIVYGDYEASKIQCEQNLKTGVGWICKKENSLFETNDVKEVLSNDEINEIKEILKYAINKINIKEDENIKL